MKNLKLFLITAFLLVGLMFSTPVDAQIADANIAIVFSTGGLGDQSFNDAADAGQKRAVTANSGITVDTVEPTTIAEIISGIESFADDGTYDLIIGVGFTATDGIAASAAAHTSQQFMIIDSVVDLPNVHSIVFAEHEGSFLAGAMAAMVSQTGDLGFLGGLDIPLINKFLEGYRQGARFIDDGIIVRHTYSPDPSNPWGDLTGGQAVAETFIEEGSDIIYAAAGGTGIGVFTAAKAASTEDNPIYGIGVDSDQDHIEEGFVLTSMIKRVDVAVESDIQDIVDGTWSNGFTEFNLAADGVGLSAMTFTQAEGNAEYEDGVTRLQKIAEIKADIISGAISVNSTYNAGFTTTPSGPLPVSTAGFIVALIALPLIVRRKK